MRLLKLCLFLAVTTFLCVRGISQTAAFTAPVKCHVPNSPSCGDDLTLAKASKDFAEIQKDRKDCGVPQLVGRNVGIRVCSPLQSVTDVNICGEASTKGFYYYWAPSEEMQDGDSVVHTLLARAKSGEIFNDYHMIIRSSESKTTEQHFALCSVPIINGISGPPEDCTTVAIITPSKTWLRGGDRNRRFCYAAAEFRPNGAIDIEYEVLTSFTAKQLSTSILALLQTNLGLQAQETSHDKDGNYISIKSVSGLRVSQVLGGGWRESVDFDFSIDKEETGKVEVRGTAHVAVCRQAVGSLTAYQGLDDAQRSTYGAKLDSLVGNTIRASCKKAEQRDGKTIVCN